MSKKLGTISAVRGRRQQNLRRYLDRRYKYEIEARVYSLEWEAGGMVWQIDLDDGLHMTNEFDREHYGGFVMPFETELNIDDFERPPRFDPFIGNPRSFNGTPPA